MRVVIKIVIIHSFNDAIVIYMSKVSVEYFCPL